MAVVPRLTMAYQSLLEQYNYTSTGVEYTGKWYSEYQGEIDIALSEPKVIYMESNISISFV